MALPDRSPEDQDRLSKLGQNTMTVVTAAGGAIADAWNSGAVNDFANKTAFLAGQIASASGGPNSSTGRIGESISRMVTSEQAQKLGQQAFEALQTGKNPYAIRSFGMSAQERAEVIGLAQNQFNTDREMKWKEEEASGSRGLRAQEMAYNSERLAALREEMAERAARDIRVNGILGQQEANEALRAKYADAREQRESALHTVQLNYSNSMLSKAIADSNIKPVMAFVGDYLKMRATTLTQTDLWYKPAVKAIHEDVFKYRGPDGAVERLKDLTELGVAKQQELDAVTKSYENIFSPELMEKAMKVYSGELNKSIDDGEGTSEPVKEDL